MTAVVLVLSASSSRAHAQSAVASGCTLMRGVYTCDGAAFRKALDDAKVIGIQANSQDGPTNGQLRQLVRSLHKQDQVEGQRADLTFLVAPISSEGVNVGPSGAELATLRVYGSRPDGTRGNLLWLETLTGQPDMPWPLVVRSLLNQFQAHLHKM